MSISYLKIEYPKKGKDGKYRLGRKIIVEVMPEIWVYKTTGRLVVFKVENII